VSYRLLNSNLIGGIDTILNNDKRKTCIGNVLIQNNHIGTHNLDFFNYK